MNKLKFNVVSILSAFFLLDTALAYYKQTLKDFSFDMNTMNEYPASYMTDGVAVPLKNKVKIVPKLPNVAGKFFSDKKLGTTEWEVQYKLKVDTKKLTVQTDPRYEDMFALWYMISKPTLKSKKVTEQFGYKPQFSGLGIFVYRQNN